eukprot:1993637-Amphidinium_carterae.1
MLIQVKNGWKGHLNHLCNGHVIVLALLQETVLSVNLLQHYKCQEQIKAQSREPLNVTLARKCAKEIPIE